MSDCVFCKIIAGEIPSFCIYEDEMFKVILDRFPSSVGHTLIIVKDHKENIYQLSEKQAAGIMALAQKVAIALKEALNCDGINILQNNGEAAGQTVNHYHMHLIPRYNNDDVVIKWTANDPSEDDFKKVMDKIKL